MGTPLYFLTPLSAPAGEAAEARGVGENLACGIMARSAGDAAAGVSSGAAHVEALHRPPIGGVAKHGAGGPKLVQGHVAVHDVAADEARSEEHTSELQSLMRISYADFCLKTKKTLTAHATTA